MTIFDGLIGAAQDTVAWPFQQAGNLVEGAASTAGNAAGGLFGGMFGGLGNWLFQLAALGLAALVVIMVVG